MFKQATLERPGELAHRLWDLAEWSKDARVLVRLMNTTESTLRLDDRKGLAEAFEMNAAVLRLLQADPLLPEQLLPKTWPGNELRRVFDSFDQAFIAAWRGWLRS